MLEKPEQNRWYDNNPKAARVFEAIRNMRNREREEFASYLLQVVDMVKSQKDDEITDLSLGKNKIFNYNFLLIRGEGNH